MAKKSFLFLTATALITSLLLGGCGPRPTLPVEKEPDFPTKPITVIVPFSAGGGSDLQVRALEKLAPKYLKQNFIVQNKTGGGGNIAYNELVTSPADGYTVGMSYTGLILQSLYGSTTYHYPTALEPIVQFSTAPIVLAIKADQPWQTLDDLIAYCKQHPGEVKFGHGGIGDTSHIIGEIFAQKSGISIEQVPFRGASESIAALLGNHIEIILGSPGALAEQIKSGTVRALAISGEKHLANPALANIPTFKESGFDIVLENWFGIASPKEIDPKIKAILADAFANMVADPEFKQSIEGLGMQVEYLNSADSIEKWRDDTEKLSKMINESGIINQIQQQKK